MPDITAIAAGLQSLTTAIEIAKELNQLAQRFKNVEANLKLTALMEALTDTKLKLVDVKEENIAFKEEVRKLKKELEVEKNLVWDPPYYWLNKGDKREGPFCQPCYDNDKKLIHLQTFGKGKFVCSVCKNSFVNNDYKPPKDDVKVVKSKWLRGIENF